METNFTQYIRNISIDSEFVKTRTDYPFSLTSVRKLSSLDLHPKVTFIIGENGSGKSTLLEAIAVASGFNPEGGSKNFNFSTEATHSVLYNHIKLIKGISAPKDGYFLRAESFYNVASNIDELDKSGGGPPLIDSYGGVSLHKQSHGESFMSLLVNRLGGSGLYIFDEPEAALSPVRQMALVRRIHQLVGLGSQLIIATHSPIVMSYPDSIIYDVDNGYEAIKYEETDHYMITREFLNKPDKMLKELFRD